MSRLAVPATRCTSNRGFALASIEDWHLDVASMTESPCNCGAISWLNPFQFHDTSFVPAGVELPVFPSDTGISVVNSEASGNGIPEGLAPSDDIIKVSRSMAAGDDRNDSNHASFAALLSAWFFDQWRTLTWFSLGAFHGTHTKQMWALFDKLIELFTG